MWHTNKQSRWSKALFCLQQTLRWGAFPKPVGCTVMPISLWQPTTVSYLDSNCSFEKHWLGPRIFYLLLTKNKPLCSKMHCTVGEGQLPMKPVQMKASYSVKRKAKQLPACFDLACTWSSACTSGPPKKLGWPRPVSQLSKACFSAVLEADSHREPLWHSGFKQGLHLSDGTR